MLGVPLHVYFKNLKNKESLMTSTRNVVKQIPNGLKILKRIISRSKRWDRVVANF